MTAPLAKHQREIGLGFLRVTTKECRDIQVVRGNFACDFANIFLNLVNDVNLVWLRRQVWLLGDFSPGLPGLRQE
jgi:hypothetical protein